MIHSANLETGGLHLRRPVVYRDVRDARARGSAAQGALEALHRLRLSLRHGFHRPVIVVRDVAVQAVAPRGVECEIAKPHSLHPAAHDESPRYPHPIRLRSRFRETGYFTAASAAWPPAPAWPSDPRRRAFRA